MNLINTVAKWLADAITRELKKPLDDLNSRIDTLQSKTDILIKWKTIEELDGKEADLAMLDDRICQLIAYCDKKGYSTAEERRRCSRMHDIYKKRGGNHGEENEYKRFLSIPTEEEWRRTNGKNSL